MSILGRAVAAATAVVAIATAVAGTTHSAASAAASEMSPAAAPLAVSTATAAPTGLIRKACSNGTSGQLCISLYGTGRANAYRVVYHLAPAPGGWMRPLTKATWLATSSADAPWEAGPRGVGFGTRYTPFCATTCAAVTKPTDFTVDSPYFALYTIIVGTPLDHRTVSAGVTPVASARGRGCAYEVEAQVQLSSTSGGIVYMLRSGRESGLFGLTFSDEGRALYDRSGHRLTTPTYVAAWSRVTNGAGAWRTGFMLSSGRVDDPYGGAGYTTDSEVGDEGVC